jgi:hypothetical protein
MSDLVDAPFISITSGATRRKKENDMSDLDGFSFFVRLTPIGSARDSLIIDGLDLQVERHPKIGQFDIAGLCRQDVGGL